MQLYSFLILILSLGGGSLPPLEISRGRSLLASAGLVLGWILLCHVAARICAKQVTQDRLDPLVGAELLEKQLQIFRWLGLLVVLTCLGVFGLAGVVASLPVVESSALLQASLLLIPGIALTVGTWSAEHCYGVMMGYTSAGFGNYARSLQRTFRSGIGWLLLPVLLILALNDVVAVLPISERAAAATTGLAILLLIVVGVPLLIGRMFQTTPLHDSSAAWVADLLSAAGVGKIRVMRWETGGRTYNALVAGFVPPLRTLLISDRLMDELPPSQIAMVVLHEAAHLRRRHMPLRMLAILPAWGAGALVTHSLGGHEWAMAGGTMFGILSTLLALKVVAYRTEHDADIQACRMAQQIAGEVPDVPATYHEAAQALADGLWRVTADQPSSRRATWLHPGIRQRVAKLQVA
jgi:Zn-dependent protease with chaperone function